MTSEQFADAVNELILKAKSAGVDDDDIITELQGIIAGIMGE